MDNDDKPINLIFERTFEVDYIPSVNQLLGVAKNGKRFLNPEVKKYKRDIQTQITKSQNTDFNYDNKRGIVVKLIFVLKKSYLMRDVDNMQKMTIDAIFQYFNVNDSKVVDLHSIKLYDDSLENEYVKVVISHSKFNLKDYSVR